MSRIDLITNAALAARLPMFYQTMLKAGRGEPRRHSLWFNSNGVTASSPGLLGTSYPGLNPSRSEPQRGCGLPSHEHHWPLAATALRLFLRAALSQGRPCGANLGLGAPNAFGVKNSALRSPQATMDRPVFNAVWYYPANAGENRRGHGRGKGTSLGAC